MSEKSPQFDFYEKVRVSSPDPGKAEVNGQLGAVLGRVETDDGGWYYAVHIYATGISWCFFENELQPTGEHAKREDFYDGSSIRIIVDERGHGRIADG